MKSHFRGRLEGESVEGEVKAGSRKEALRQLREDGVDVTSLEPLPAGRPKREHGARPRKKSRLPAIALPELSFLGVNWGLWLVLILGLLGVALMIYFLLRNLPGSGVGKPPTPRRAVTDYVKKSFLNTGEGYKIVEWSDPLENSEPFVLIQFGPDGEPLDKITAKPGEAVAYRVKIQTEVDHRRRGDQLAGYVDREGLLDVVFVVSRQTGLVMVREGEIAFNWDRRHKEKEKWVPAREPH